ncbi:MAG: adenosylcobinamide-phosphate synthase CbiB [Anaerolineae bacterium]
MSRVLVIILAVGLDWLWGDPPNRFHPLLLMGRWLTWGRRLAPRRHRFWFGAGWTLGGMLLFSLPLWKAEIWKDEGRRMKDEVFHFHPSSFIPHPFLLKPVFAYRNLRRAVLSVAEALGRADFPEARRLLSWHLVSRDTGDLSEAEVAGAAIESLAENLTDSLTAPLLAYAAGGLPAAWGYRFINTADAMWGYRSAEFEQLGKFAARLDDLINWLPARLTGWLLVFAAWLGSEDARNAARTMLAQHGRTASPNSGWTMSAMAGALGVTLDKRRVYALEGGRGRLDVTTMQRALRMADLCAGLVVVTALAVAVVRQRR